MKKTMSIVLVLSMLLSMLLVVPVSAEGEPVPDPNITTEEPTDDSTTTPPATGSGDDSKGDSNQSQDTTPTPPPSDGTGETDPTDPTPTPPPAVNGGLGAGAPNATGTFAYAANGVNTQPEEPADLSEHDIYWGFNTDDDNMGWVASNNAVFVGVAEGRANVDNPTVKNDPRLASPKFSIDGSDYSTVELRMKVNKYIILDQSKTTNDFKPILYIATEDKPSYTAPVRSINADKTYSKNDGTNLETDYVVYTFDVGNSSEWKGKTVTQIYLDALRETSNADIDYIRIKFAGYHVDFVVEGAYTAAIPSQYYIEPGSTLASLSVADPARMGREFLGWSPTGDAADVVDPATYTIDESQTLYAVWGEPQDIRIEFDGTEVPPYLGINNKQDAVVADGILTVTPSKTDSYLTFSSDNLNVPAAIYTTLVVAMKSDDPAFTKPELYIEPATGSWSGNSGYVALEPDETKEIENGFLEFTYDMTKYSGWTGNVRSIRIDPTNATDNYYFDYLHILKSEGVFVKLSAGAGKVPSAKLTPDADGNVTLPAAVLSGYEFLGWADTADGEAVYPAGEKILVTDNMELFAKYRYLYREAWDFSDGTTQGWTGTLDGIGVVEDDGVQVMVGTPKKQSSTPPYDPIFNSNGSLGISTEKITGVEVVMKYTDTTLAENAYAQVYFKVDGKGISEETAVKVPIDKATAPAGEYVTYTFSILKADGSTPDWWTGKLDQIRFDPYNADDAESHANQKVYVKSIQLIEKDLPKVTAANIANGATKADYRLGKLTLTFDRDMDASTITAANFSSEWFIDAAYDAATKTASLYFKMQDERPLTGKTVTFTPNGVKDANGLAFMPGEQYTFTFAPHDNEMYLDGDNLVMNGTFDDPYNPFFGIPGTFVDDAQRGKVLYYANTINSNWPQFKAYTAVTKGQKYFLSVDLKVEKPNDPKAPARTSTTMCARIMDRAGDNGSSDLISLSGNAVYGQWATFSGFGVADVAASQDKTPTFDTAAVRVWPNPLEVSKDEKYGHPFYLDNVILKKAFTMSFAAGDGATEVAAIASKDIYKGMTLTLPTKTEANQAYSKLGFRITGWTDGTANYAFGADYTVANGADVTITPVWEDANVTYSFEAAPNVTAEGDLPQGATVPAGTEIALPQNAQTVQGYVFTGWLDTETGKLYPAGAAYIVNDTTVFQPVFENTSESVLGYRAEFTDDADGWKGGNSATTEHLAEGMLKMTGTKHDARMETPEISIDTAKYPILRILAKNDCASTKMLLRWQRDDTMATVAGVVAAEGAKYRADIPMNTGSEWQEITFDLTTGSNAQNWKDTVNKLWVDFCDGAANGGTVTYDYVRFYKKGNNTLTYHANTTDPVTNMPANDTMAGIGEYALSGLVPQRAGYVFAGWSTDPDAAVGSDTVTVDGDITVYAIWAEPITISFANTTPGVSGEAPSAIVTGKGVEITIPGNTTYTYDDGTHVFGGWQADGEIIKPGVSVAFQQDTTLEAVWTLETADLTDNEDLAGTGAVRLVIADLDEVADADLLAAIRAILKDGWSLDYSFSATPFDENGNSMNTLAAPAKLRIPLHRLQALEANERYVIYHIDLTDPANPVATAVPYAMSQDGKYLEFSQKDFSPFIVVRQPAVGGEYQPKGAYVREKGEYVIDLYVSGAKYNLGSFGFHYDPAVMTFKSISYTNGIASTDDTNHFYKHDAEQGIIADQWIVPTVGSGHIDATAAPVRVASIAFTMTAENYAIFAANPTSYFVPDTTAQNADSFYLDGNYLVALHEPSTTVNYVPIFMQAVVNTPERLPVTLQGIDGFATSSLTETETAESLKDYTFFITLNENIEAPKGASYTIGTGTAKNLSAPVIEGSKYTYTIPGADVTGSIAIRFQFENEITDAEIRVTAPEAGATPESEATALGTFYTVSDVTWTPAIAAGGTFGYNASYTATVTLTAVTPFTFGSAVNVKINDQSATSVKKNDDGTVTASYTFASTAKKQIGDVTVTVSDAVIPAKGDTVLTGDAAKAAVTLAAGANYTVLSAGMDTTDTTYKAATEYEFQFILTPDADSEFSDGATTVVDSKGNEYEVVDEVIDNDGNLVITFIAGTTEDPVLSGTIRTVRADGTLLKQDKKAVIEVYANDDADLETVLATIHPEEELVKGTSVDFSFELDAGSYKLVIKKPGYLNMIVTNVVVTNDKDYTLAPITLVAGDVSTEESSKDVVNTDDLTAVIRGFDTSDEFDEVANACDINEDGVCNVLDYAYVKSNIAATVESITIDASKMTA